MPIGIEPPPGTGPGDSIISPGGGGGGGGAPSFDPGSGVSDLKSRLGSAENALEQTRKKRQRQIKEEVQEAKSVRSEAKSIRDRAEGILSDPLARKAGVKGTAESVKQKAQQLIGSADRFLSQYG